MVSLYSHKTGVLLGKIQESVTGFFGWGNRFRRSKFWGECVHSWNARGSQVYQPVFDVFGMGLWHPPTKACEADSPLCHSLTFHFIFIGYIHSSLHCMDKCFSFDLLTFSHGRLISFVAQILDLNDWHFSSSMGHSNPKFGHRVLLNQFDYFCSK